MALPQLNSCCACFSLRTGCLILGWAVCLFSAAHLFPMGESTTRSKINSGFNYSMDADALFNLIFAIVLLVGIYKERAAFLLPYLILSVLEIIAYIIIFLILIFASGVIVGSSHTKQSDKDAVTIALTSLFITFGIAGAFKVYFFLVVKSYYNELKESL